MKSKNFIQNEDGLALVVALMLLVLMSVMGLAALSTSTTELQLTSNERTDARAFHAAEAGIKEVLYRSTLAGLGATTIANGGSMATVDGVTFDAAIQSALSADWEYRIFAGTPPASPDPANIIHSRVLMPSADAKKLKYTLADSDPNYDPGEVLRVRNVIEQDLLDWGVTSGGTGVGADLNGDGDYMDLVFFDPNATVMDRVGANTMQNGVADTEAPPTLNGNMVVRLVTATGYSGRGKKTIMLETTGYPVNPNVNAAVQTEIPITLGGSGFVSGYNHSINTTRDDDTNRDSSLYDDNGCDNLSQGAGTGGCGYGPGDDPDAGELADYSGMLEAEGHKPAILSSEADPATAVDQLGSNVEAWGGDEDGTKGWLETGAGDFPDLATLLGMDNPADLQRILDNAKTDPAACPTGVTYIDNDNSDLYRPDQNCASGSGILVVTGDVKIASNFDFKGLVYVEGDAELRGGTWILGSMAVKGVTDGVSVANGNPTILYSRETVIQAVTAAFNTVGFAFTNLSWREF